MMTRLAVALILVLGASIALGSTVEEQAKQSLEKRNAGTGTAKKENQ